MMHEVKHLPKEMKKIYLAGKCDPKNDWRGYFNDQNGIFWLEQDEWRDHMFVHPRGFICTGPFPTAAKTAHGSAYGSPHQAIGYVGDTLTNLMEQCQRSMEASTLVFAYMDSYDAYGTLVEIGWAAAKGLPLYICFAENMFDVASYGGANVAPANTFSVTRSMMAGQLWFAAEMADEFYFSDNPLSCLDDVLRNRSRRWS